MAGPRDLTVEEQELGYLPLDILYCWEKWVQRRVESVQFIDHLSLRRRVSVDMIVPDRVTRTSPSGEPYYWLPLALLRKRRLRNLNLRDAQGRALPVLTSEQNGIVATAVLLASARARAAASSPHGVPDPDTIPKSIREDLWIIAHAPREMAKDRWERLGRSRSGTDGPERAWREFLIGDEEFMSLARDLAINFILITQVEAKAGDRMIFKYSYDEEPRPTYLALRRSARRNLRRISGRLGALLKGEKDPEPEGAKGLLHVECSKEVIDHPTQTPATTPEPQAQVKVVVTASNGAQREKVTDARGKTWFALTKGTYGVETLTPPGMLELDEPTRAVAVEPGDTTAIRFRYRQIASLASQMDSIAGAPPERLRHRLLRNVGWRARAFVIQTPAIAHAKSYHLEVVAPDELKLTRARFAARPAYWIPNGKPPSVRADMEFGSMQRAHLHLRNIDQSFSGMCRVHLRPLATTVVQPATISSAISLGLLVILACRLDDVAANAAPISTLLLLVPGGLSAYIARQRESQLATQMVLAPRALALLSGGASLAAAAVLVLGRSWTFDDKAHVMVPGPLTVGFHVTIWSLVGLALVTFLLLAGCWMYTIRMPEGRESTTGAMRPESGIGFAPQEVDTDPSKESLTLP